MKRLVSIILSTMLIISMLTTLSGCSEKTSEGLEFVSNGDGTCTWIGLGSCTDTEIIVPEKNGDEKVVSVGEETIIHNDKITKIILPDSIKTLEEKALAYCDTLVEIDFGNGLETIADYGVANCEKLEKVIFSNALKSIGESAFAGASLTEIILPEGVETIGIGAFSGNDEVTKISIPKSINEFNTRAFCVESLQEIEIKSEMNYFSIDISTNSNGEISVDGGVCVDPETTKSPKQYTGLCTQENLADILCAILDKESIKLNGESVSPKLTVKDGVYENNNDMYSFEFITATKEVKILHGIREMTQVATLKYEEDSSTKYISANGTGDYYGETINYTIDVLPFGNDIFVVMAIEEDLIDGIWHKE